MKTRYSNRVNVVKVGFGKDLLGHENIGAMTPYNAVNALMNGAKITLGGI